MAENLNINNLTLDDNSFKLLDEGTYRFRVAGHSIDYYSGNSTKIPANTQVVSCELEIPYTDESGNIATATVKNNLNIYKKALFAVRQFAECIGLCSEKGRESINLEDMDGKTGVCEITHREGNDGNEYNNVKICYAPSKAPKVCVNDEEWKKWESGGDFVTDSEGENPWENS